MVAAGSSKITAGDDDSDLVAIQLDPEVTDAVRLQAYVVYGLRCLGAYDPLAFKMCWTRTPEPLRQHPVLQHCRQLALALLRRDYVQFWELLDAFIWDEEFNELIDAVRRSVRQRISKLISAAYSCIEISQVRSMMGLPAPGSLDDWFPGHRIEAIGDRSFMCISKTCRSTSSPISFDEMRVYVQHVLKLDDIAF